jgi:hypothetical protein
MAPLQQSYYCDYYNNHNHIIVIIIIIIAVVVTRGRYVQHGTVQNYSSVLTALLQIYIISYCTTGGMILLDVH